MKENKNIYEYSTNIKCADTEIDLNLETQRLIEICQEAAIRYFDLYNLGLVSRSKTNIALIIMYTAIQMDKNIKWKDNVKIEVWTSKIDKLYIYVNYDIIVNKKVIGRAKTKFLLYDIKNKKIKRIDNDILNRIPILEKKGYNPKVINNSLIKTLYINTSLIK